jgi:hypothetical protein
MQRQDGEGALLQGCGLILLPNPNGIQGILGMEVNICRTKGHPKRPKRLVLHLYPCFEILQTTWVHLARYTFSEVGDLIFDPAMLMIIFALDDNTFESNIKSLEDLFRIRVQAPRQGFQIRFKQCMHHIPIVHQAVPSANGVQTSPTKALPYHTYLYNLQRLGMVTGFMQIFAPYDIPRGAGNEVDNMYPIFRQAA